MALSAVFTTMTMASVPERSCTSVTVPLILTSLLGSYAGPFLLLWAAAPTNANELMMAVARIFDHCMAIVVPPAGLRRCKNRVAFTAGCTRQQAAVLAPLAGN